MLFNINTLEWDQELLDILGIPKSMMPTVKSSSEIYGHTKTTIFAHEVPISGIAGDQQAALFGQMCIKTGAIKNTYGTGCFVMLNTGNKPVISKNNLLTTIAWKIGNETTYALEGSIYVGGSVVQWLRDGLGVIKSSAEVEDLASTVPRQRRRLLRTGTHRPGSSLLGPVCPRHHGRHHPWHHGSPHRTRCFGRHCLPDLRHRTGHGQRHECSARKLKVDGGASRNNLLMQYQADLLGINVVRPRVTETTALGAAYLPVWLSASGRTSMRSRASGRKSAHSCPPPTPSRSRRRRNCGQMLFAEP
jgi:glycerol kinase